MKKHACSLVVAALAAVLLCGCGPGPGQEIKLLSSHQKTFTILAIDPPKHVYVDLKDEKNQLFTHVYVSKHCNNWRDIKLGSAITLTVNQYERGTDRWARIEAGPVCPRS